MAKTIAGILIGIILIVITVGETCVCIISGGADKDARESFQRWLEKKKNDVDKRQDEE